MPDKVDTRAHLRFKPDPMEYAQVSVEDLEQEFRPNFVALIVEESPIAGCSLIAHDYPGIDVGTECMVKIGNLAPLHACVKWKKITEPELMRVGIKFLE